MRETGVGYPDVTLFPVLAEVLSVPIGVLFGEENNTQEENNMTNASPPLTSKTVFSDTQSVRVLLGNVCRVEFIERRVADILDDGTGVLDGIDGILVHTTGDPVFLRYLETEKEDGCLLVKIKNPCGSDDQWQPYDRQGYSGENVVEITAQSWDERDINVVNYLDLHATAQTNAAGHYEVICRPAAVYNDVYDAANGN